MYNKWAYPQILDRTSQVLQLFLQFPDLLFGLRFLKNNYVHENVKLIIVT